MRTYSWLILFHSTHTLDFKNPKDVAKCRDSQDVKQDLIECKYHGGELHYSSPQMIDSDHRVYSTLPENDSRREKRVLVKLNDANTKSEHQNDIRKKTRNKNRIDDGTAE